LLKLLERICLRRITQFLASNRHQFGAYLETGGR
jgi:hypothetical protein